MTMFAIYPGEMTAAASQSFVLYAATVTRYIYRFVTNFSVWVFPTLRALVEERRYRDMERRLSMKGKRPTAADAESSDPVRPLLIAGKLRLAAAAAHKSKRLQTIESNESFVEWENEALSRMRRRALWAGAMDVQGYLFVLLFWVGGAWVIFAYANLAYDNLGRGVEVRFLESWGASALFDLWGIEALKVLASRTVYVLLFRLLVSLSTGSGVSSLKFLEDALEVQAEGAGGRRTRHAIRVNRVYDEESAAFGGE